MAATTRLVAPLAGLTERIVALALVAAALALVVPSRPLSRRSDLLLAALVLLTALGIAPGRLVALRTRPRALLALSVGPLLALTGLAWALGRPFADPTRDGILALGLSSSEVASVGLVALAGGDAVLALGVLTGSLVTSAVLGPLLAAGLGHTAGHVSSTTLLGRFALVVLVPLVVGLAARRILPAIGRGEGALGGLSTLTVCALVYAALSGVSAGQQLSGAVLGSLAFLLASGLLALVATRLASRLDAASVGLPVGLRDFAVAAALASQAFGPRAAGVAGVYGVLMLIAGAVTATLLRRPAAAQLPGTAPDER